MKSFITVDDLTELSVDRFRARVLNQDMPVAFAFLGVIAENDMDKSGGWRSSVFFDLFRSIYPDVELGEFIEGFENSGFLEDQNTKALNDFLGSLIQDIKKRSQSL